MSPDNWGKAAERLVPGKRVYLVEDDHALRLWLAMDLGGRGYSVACFDSGRRFLQAADALAPGCVLSDLRMAEGDGFELLEGLAGRHARFPVILMTAFADIPIAVQAIRLGAVELVQKPFTGEDITQCIDSVLLRFPGTGSQAALEQAAETARKQLDVLTPREREVIECVLEGMPNKRIASKLGISSRTVELHRAHLMDKLGLRNVSQLVRLALVASGRADVSHLQA